MAIDPKTLPLNFLKRMSPESRRPLGKAGILPQEAEAARQAKGERDLQTTLTGYLRTRGITTLVAPFGKKSRMREGWPDITFALYGRACAWEVKFEHGKLSAEQAKTHNEMVAPPNNWRVAIIRSVEEAKAFLDLLQKEVLAS